MIVLVLIGRVLIGRGSTSHVSQARTCLGRIGLAWTAAIGISVPGWIAQALIVPAHNLVLMFQERIALNHASTAMCLVVGRRGRSFRASIALPTVPSWTVAAEAPEQRLPIRSLAHDPIGPPIAPAPKCPAVRRARAPKMHQAAPVNWIAALLDGFPTTAIVSLVLTVSPASIGSQARIDPARLRA